MEKLSGKKKTAVLISGRGSNLRSLIKYSKKKKSLIRIVLVVSNNFSAKGLNYANKSNINNIVIKYSNRKSFEDRLLKLLRRNNVDLICLAGFMKILSGKFIKKLNKTILNIHPSLLPKYSGGMDEDVHAKVLKNKDTETGCTIHFVTEAVDAGPIFIQKRCRVNSSDTIQTLKAKVQTLEGDAFLEAIPLFESKYHNKNGKK